MANRELKGRLGWVPTSAGFEAYVSALRHTWGNSETRAWLQRMKELEPVADEQDSVRVEAVDAGQVATAWVDYAAAQRLMKPGTHMTASSFADGDAANSLLISAAAVRKSALHEREALRALRFLAGEWVQTYLAERAYEYPARAGIVERGRFGFPAGLHPSFVDPQAVVDLTPTRAMLRRLALP